MDEIDVIVRIADKRKPKIRRGVIVSVYPSTVKVQPRGSTRYIECSYNSSQPVAVGKTCVYEFISKQYVITSVANTPNKTDITQGTGSSQRSDHLLHDNIGGEFDAAAVKATPDGADVLLLEDSADSQRKKSATLTSLLAFLGSVYNRVMNQGSNLTQRAKLNFVNGSGVTLMAADNSGATRTDVTAALDITSLSEDTSPSAANDFLLEYDVSASAHKKVKIQNVPVSATDTDAFHQSASAEIHGLTQKVTPVGNDEILIEDSAASYVKKRLKVSSLPSGGGGGAATLWVLLNNTDINNTTTETSLINRSGAVGAGSLTLPVNWFSLGRGYEITVDFGFGSAASPGNFTVRSTLQGNEVFTTGANPLPASFGYSGVMRLRLICTDDSIPASMQVRANLEMWIANGDPTPQTPFLFFAGGGSYAIDATVTNDIDFLWTFDTASASNDMGTQLAMIREIPAP